MINLINKSNFLEIFIWEYNNSSVKKDFNSMLIQYTNIIVFRKRQLKETVDKNVTLDRKTQFSPVIGILDDL